MSTKKKTEAPPKTPMEDLLGPTLMTDVKGTTTPTKKALENKDLVALYFSAKWCPPCRAFSPMLKDFYKACAEKGKMEIVYISSDKSIPEFQEYYGGMPWLSLPEGKGNVAEIKNNLAKVMQIRGIPTLIVLDVKTGNFITASAREDVTKDQSMATVEGWKGIEAVPLAEADMNASSGGPQSGFMKIIFYILKNPIYIFGLLYFYKQFMKYLNKDSGTPDAIVDDPNEEPPIVPGEEPEF